MCVYVYVCMRVCVYMYIFMYALVNAPTQFTATSVKWTRADPKFAAGARVLKAQVYVCVYVCIYIYDMYVFFFCVCIYIYANICDLCVYIYTHIYTHTGGDKTQANQA
jgi:hypothetical protein